MTTYLLRRGNGNGNEGAYRPVARGAQGAGLPPGSFMPGVALPLPRRRVVRGDEVDFADFMKPVSRRAGAGTGKPVRIRTAGLDGADDDENDLSGEGSATGADGSNGADGANGGAVNVGTVSVGDPGGGASGNPAAGGSYSLAGQNPLLGGQGDDVQAPPGGVTASAGGTLPAGGGDGSSPQGEDGAAPWYVKVGSRGYGNDADANDTASAFGLGTGQGPGSGDGLLDTITGGSGVSLGGQGATPPPEDAALAPVDWTKSYVGGVGPGGITAGINGDTQGDGSDGGAKSWYQLLGDGQDHEQQPVVQFPGAPGMGKQQGGKLPVPQFPDVYGTGGTADTQYNWTGPHVEFPDAEHAQILAAKQKENDAVAANGPRDYTVGDSGLRFSQDFPYKGIQQAHEDGVIPDDVAQRLAETQMQREQDLAAANAGGVYHPEAKLFMVKADPDDPTKAIYAAVPDTNNNKIKGATIFINGMDNDLQSAANLGLNHTGKSAFYMIYNPSGGLGSDIMRSIPERLGASIPVDNTTSDILDRNFDLPSASVYAHSQGTLITNNALNNLAIPRQNTQETTPYYQIPNTKGLKINYDGSAANEGTTQDIANRAGATVERFEGNPYDPVHNLVGLNTTNPLRIVASVAGIPYLFSNDRNMSPHSYVGGGSRWRWANEDPLLK